MGFPSGHTHVPTEPGNKKSPKVAEQARWDLISNAWHIPCLRFWALCILFSTGVQPATSEFATANIYLPWRGFKGDLPGPDPFIKLHGLTGQRFVQEYMACLDHRLVSTVMPYSSLFDPPDSDLNQFRAFLGRAGFKNYGLWQPDLLEAECRAAFQASVDSQTGFHLARDAIPRIVPHGLTPLQHVGCAQSIEDLPFDSPAPLSWATRYAIDTSVRLGPEVRDLRKREIRRLRRKAKQLRP